MNTNKVVVVVLAIFTLWNIVALFNFLYFLWILSTNGFVPIACVAGYMWYKKNHYIEEEPRDITPSVSQQDLHSLLEGKNITIQIKKN